MSHVVDVKLEIKDLDALAKACESIGLELVRDQKTYKWFGSYMGDYPLPQGFKKSDLGKCEHAIRVKCNTKAYEIGLVASRTGDGYTALFDFWSGGYGLEELAGKNLANVKESYAAEVARKEMKKKGFAVKFATNKKTGRKQLICTRMVR